MSSVIASCETKSRALDRHDCSAHLKSFESHINITGVKGDIDPNNVSKTLEYYSRLSPVMYSSVD